MSIWTSRRLCAAAVVAACLAGCDVTAGLGMSPGAGKDPLSRAPLADGAVQVATPFGYCLDPRSLRRDFALVARCDTLGADGPYGGLDLAVITVTATPLDDGAPAPDLASLGSSLTGAEILREDTRRGLPLILARRSASPAPDLSALHWRAAFALGGQLVSLALYAPEGSDVLDTDGATLLTDLVAATRLATAQPGAAKAMLKE